MCGVYVVFVLLACGEIVSVSALFGVSTGCAFVCGICGCESRMCMVIVWLIISALATVLSAVTVQGQGGPWFWGVIRHHLCSLSKKSENSSKSSDDGRVSESSITPECEQRPS